MATNRSENLKKAEEEAFKAAKESIAEAIALFEQMSLRQVFCIPSSFKVRFGCLEVDGFLRGAIIWTDNDGMTYQFFASEEIRLNLSKFAEFLGTGFLQYLKSCADVQMHVAQTITTACTEFLANTPASTKMTARA